jgi:putative RNA 2'-phosphotransferase
MKLSKEISYALRHAPWEYELELDDSGWVKISQVLEALKCKEEWLHLTEQDLHTMIDVNDKKRHEIQDGKIRALYGHSIPQKIMKVRQEPPEVLFHGTARKFIQSIKETGLIPGQRQYVHLSVDVETAKQVGKRRDDDPIVLKINAQDAWRAGINFCVGNEKVWLADSIPSRFISL